MTAAMPRPDAAGAAQETGSSERPLVLLAEDSPTQAAWLAAVLREGGYDVSIAADGLSALQSARSSPPAVIVSDIDMPGLDGFDLCQTVKKDAALRGIPFLVVTHRDRATDIVRALEVGADNYLTKPIDPQQVVSRIHRILADVNSWRARTSGGRYRRPLEAEDFVLSLERSQITELLMATAEKLEEEIAALGELGARLAMVQEPAELLELATRRTRELSEADAAWIALLEDGRWQLRALSSASGAKVRAPREDVPIEQQFQLSSARLRQREPFHLPYPEEGRERAGAASNAALVETYGWPLVVGSDLIGVLAISYAGPHALTASERRRFVHLANQTAIGVENTRRFERERALRNELEAAYAAEKKAHKNALFMLAAAVEARDGLTGAHLRRVGAYAELIARELGCEPAFIEEIAYSSMLHDVGKLLVADAVLGKPGALTSEEWAEMRRHPVYGAQILGSQPFFQMAGEIALSHHERWDGSGYPASLKGEQIPLSARITSVADVFDALTTRRHYKEAWLPEAALQEILSLEGSSFDPAVVRAFVCLFEGGEIERVLRAAASEEAVPRGTALLDRISMPARPAAGAPKGSDVA